MEWRPPTDDCALAAAVGAHGAAGCRAVLTAKEALLAADAVDEELERALAAVQAGQADEDERFGRVLARGEHARFDLKLPINARTKPALDAALGALRAVLGELLSEQCMCVELAALVAEPGAEAQPWHPDTQIPTGGGGGTPLYTAFIALQDVGAEMGPTELLLGTHTADAHAAAREAGGAAAVEGIAGEGDAYVMDSRTWHRGGANASRARRRLLYATFCAPGNSPPPGSTLSLLDVFEGRLRLCAHRAWA